MIWIVSIDYGSTTYRWASSNVTWDVVDEDGLPLSFVGSWAGPHAVHRDEAIPVEVVFPSSLNIAAEESAGRVLLSGAEVEVSLLSAGGTWARREVVRRGQVSEPEIGGPLEPVIFSIDVEDVDAALIPSATCVVTRETHGGASSSVIGLSYPVVYGSPGTFYSDDGSLIHLGATPAIVIQSSSVTAGSPAVTTVYADRLLINNGPVLPTTTEVNLIYADPESRSGYSLLVCPCYVTVDGLNQTITKIDVSGESDAVRTAGSYFISWPTGATPLDTVTDTDAAGAVLLWWLRRSSLKIDIARSQTGLSFLNAYTLSGFVDSPISPLDWAADRLASYPVQIINAANGLVVVPIRFQASTADAIAAITVDDPLVAAVSGGTTGTIRIGPMRCSGKNQVTEVRVSWARGIGTGTFYGRTIRTSDPTASMMVQSNAGTVGTVPRSAAIRSIEVSLTDCFDAATAYKVAEYVAWRDGAPRRTVTVAVPTADFATLMEGDVITFSDATLGITDRVALVDSIGLTSAAMMELELVLP